ncbi:7013_t:CDS:2, partial [Racocetra fulgida]
AIAKIYTFYYTNIKKELRFYSSELLECDLKDSVNGSIINLSQLEIIDQNFSEEFEHISESCQLQLDNINGTNLSIEEAVDISKVASEEKLEPISLNTTGFCIIKDQIHCEEGVVRQWAFICVYNQNYDSNLKKDTGLKKVGCPFLINASFSKINNPEVLVFINKMKDKHNHKLDRSMIEFEESKKFTNEILEDIKFMTVLCKFDMTVQRKFLENKYSLQPIFPKDLYAAINKFCLTHKTLSNDVAQVLNWLDHHKKIDSQWFVVCGYSMALSLFVGFNKDRRNILLAQGLIADETINFHVWIFNKLLEVTGIYPATYWSTEAFVEENINEQSDSGEKYSGRDDHLVVKELYPYMKVVGLKLKSNINANVKNVEMQAIIKKIAK